MSEFDYNPNGESFTGASLDGNMEQSINEPTAEQMPQQNNEIDINKIMNEAGQDQTPLPEDNEVQRILDGGEIQSSLPDVNEELLLPENFGEANNLNVEQNTTEPAEQGIEASLSPEMEQTKELNEIQKQNFEMTKRLAEKYSNALKKCTNAKGLEYYVLRDKNNATPVAYEDYYVESVTLLSQDGVTNFYIPSDGDRIDQIKNGRYDLSPVFGRNPEEFDFPVHLNFNGYSEKWVIPHTKNFKDIKDPSDLKEQLVEAEKMRAAEVVIPEANKTVEEMIAEY